MPDYKEEEGESEESMNDSLKSHCFYLKSVGLHPDACKSIAYLTFCEVSNITFNLQN